MSAKFYSILIFLLFTSFLAKGINIDSLLQVWKDESLSDSLRFQAAYSYIYYSYALVNPDTALILGRELQDEAKEKNSLYGEGKALILIGTCYSLQSQCEKGLESYYKAIEKFKLANHKYGLVQAYNNIGVCLHFSGDYLKAIDSYLKGLKIAEEEEIYDKYRWANMGNLSKVYEELGDYDQALIYIQKVADQAKDSIVIAGAYHSLSTIYIQLESYSKANDYINQSIELGRTQNNSIGLAFAYLDKGKLAIKLEDYEEAQKVLVEAERLYEQLNNSQYLASAYAQKGILYYHLNQFKKGLEWCEKADEIVSHGEFWSVKAEVCECKFLNKVKLKDFKGAFNDHLEYAQLQDSLRNLNSIRTSAQMAMQFMFDLEKKNMEAEQNEALLQAELKQSKELLNAHWAIGILLSSILVISLLFFYYHKKRMDNQHLKMQEKNAALLNKNLELERFAFITSHDLREPIRNISAFTDLLRRKIDDPESVEYLGFIKAATTKMYKLIDSILTFTKVNSKKEQFELVDLNQIVQDVKENLHQKLKENNVIFSCPELPQIYGSASQLAILFQNIIENAIKHNEKKQPKIDIQFQESAMEYTFSVKDNGKGVDKQYFEKMFQPFSRLDADNEGSGLGLSIAKNIVKQHNGKIWLDSRVGIGTTIHFTLKKRSDLRTQKQNQLMEAID